MQPTVRIDVETTWDGLKGTRDKGFLGSRCIAIVSVRAPRYAKKK